MTINANIIKKKAHPKMLLTMAVPVPVIKQKPRTNIVQMMVVVQKHAITIKAVANLRSLKFVSLTG